MDKLNLPDTQQKKNVFVTQLNDKDDLDEIRTPGSIIPESWYDLLDGDKKKALQCQSLSNPEDNMASIKEELCEKRRQFENRMEGIAKRRSALEEKRQKMKERVLRFERFIQENNQKRERAFVKYQNENETKRKKAEECSLLYQKIIELKKRYAYLTKKIEKYAIYRKFLNQIIETLPEDYACVSDDKLQSLLLRYETLNSANDKLVKRLSNAGQQLEELRQSQEEIEGIRAKEQFEAYHKKADLLKELEEHTELNQKKEQFLLSNKGNERDRKLELNIILLAIDTIAEKCRPSTSERIEDLNVDEKLERIKEWLLNQSSVVEFLKTELNETKGNTNHQPTMKSVSIKISEPDQKGEK